MNVNSKTLVICLLVIGSLIYFWLLIVVQHYHVKKLHIYDDSIAGQFSFTNRSNFVHKKVLASKTSSQCFPYNSKDWLENKRFSNAIDDNNHIHEYERYIQTSILSIESNGGLIAVNEQYFQELLQYTLCHEKSKFLSTAFTKEFINNHFLSVNDNNNLNSDQTIRTLAVRLIYLAVHIHQHEHAIKEATFRFSHRHKQQQCQMEMESKNIRPFDFECPNAKFLVVPMKQRGLGATMRTDVSNALIAGLASNRVVLFVNNISKGPDFLQPKWALSSCPRGDKQCFFLPDSPCVLTYDEIQNATILERNDRRKLFKTGQLPPHVSTVRVITMNMLTRPQRLPSNLHDKLIQIIEQYTVQPLKKANPNDSRLPLLSAAIEEIYNGGENDGGKFNYFGRNSKIHHAMVFYAMRPKFYFTKKLNNIISEIFENNVCDTEFTMGLPIRSSDKCIDESECFSFDTYMELLESVWSENIQQYDSSMSPTTNISIILTSESSDIMKAKTTFERVKELQFPLRGSSHSWLNTSSQSHFHFVTNKFDVYQNSGNPTKMNVEMNKEDILLATIASIKMQLHAKYIVGNCCSNHHLLIFDYLQEGCGAVHDDIAECVQDHKDPKFHLCCGWTKTEACRVKRKIREVNEVKAIES